MKITALLSIVFILLVSCVEGRAESWIELKDEHFIVLAQSDSVPMKDILYAAEKFYRHIASDLGYPRTSDFWTWEKRVKIRIYPDKASYQKAAKQPEWSEGAADYLSKEISSYQGSPQFIDSILPHEMAHLILRDFVKFTDSEIPSWLDEGIAQWAEYYGTQADLRQKAKELFDKDSLMSVRDVFNLHINYVNRGEKKIYWRWVRGKKDNWGVLVLSPDVLLNTFYIESGSLISFLVDTYGSLRFAGFCRELRDGKNVEEALQQVYSEYIHNVDDLDSKWREYLQK